jgi:chalcone and stilbene synthase-like protein
LAEYGNMSSATVLFILDRLRQSGAEGPCVAIAFGPGLVVEVASNNFGKSSKACPSSGYAIRTCLSIDFRFASETLSLYISLAHSGASRGRIQKGIPQEWSHSLSAFEEAKA